MTIHFGAVPAGSVLPIIFGAYGTNGESITLTGLATTDVEIYKGTSVTQRASDAGYALIDTDGIDIDSTTGIHGFSIDTGDNTDSGFYSVGSFFTVVVSAVTINSQTVNFVAATFRIVAAESSAGTPKADVSHFGGSAGTFSSGRPEVNTTHAAGTAWGSGAITAASIATGAITNAKFAAGAIDAAAIANGAIDAATFAADVDAEILSYIVDDATRIDASALNTATGTTIPAILVDTGTTLDGKIDTIDGIVDAILDDTGTSGVASVTGAVGSVTGNVGGNVTGTIGGLTAAALKDFFDTDTTTDYASAVPGSVVKEIADNAGGSSLTAADIADAVWEEAIGDHSGTTGSTAEQLAAAGAAGDPWATALPGAYGSGTAGKIVGDNLNATVSSRATQASVDTIDGIVDSILVDTTEIGAAGAGLSAIPWNAAWDAEVQSEATDALNAYDPPTKAETDALLTTTLTESYAANGAAGTLTQMLYSIQQTLQMFAIAGTSYTVKKLDNSTTAFVITINDASTPTAAERS